MHSLRPAASRETVLPLGTVVVTTSNTGVHSGRRIISSTQHARLVGTDRVELATTDEPVCSEDVILCSADDPRPKPFGQIGRPCSGKCLLASGGILLAGDDHGTLPRGEVVSSTRYDRGGVGRCETRPVRVTA